VTDITTQRREDDAPDEALATPETTDAEATSADTSESSAEAGAASGLSTAPSEDVTLPRLSPFEMLRWAWRQLTSMRIALVLLFLLSLAAVPGSLLPQRPVNPGAVTNYFAAHKFWAPILNHLGAFNVFSSPWFAAIYLLLFISLIGCVVPRTKVHLRTLRTKPPRAPRNLDRLPGHRAAKVDAEPDAALRAAAALLRRRRFRVVRADDAAGGYVSAEKGYLREAGNLLFHLSLLAILVAVGLGHFFGYKGAVLVTEGDTFADAQLNYSEFTPGTSFNPSELPPFSIKLDSFKATYQTSGTQFGAPRTFDANVTYQDSPSSPQRRADLQVNHPIVVHGVKVFLEGHGYAPIFTIKDGKGTTVLDGPQQFFEESNDPNLTSTGVVKAPDAQPDGIGLVGIFMPDAVATSEGVKSAFPQAINPAVMINAWVGNLDMNDGTPQNVYVLDTSHMKQLRLGGPGQTAVMLKPGQSVKLPGGYGTVTFDGVKQWVQLNIAYDPGKNLALGGAIAAVVGLILSLGIRRRRVWVRATPRASGGAVVSVGGLARGESPALLPELTSITNALRDDLARHQRAPRGMPAQAGARRGETPNTVKEK
jgi:cytochrome c biogenesis protein